MCSGWDFAVYLISIRVLFSCTVWVTLENTIRRGFNDCIADSKDTNDTVVFISDEENLFNHLFNRYNNRIRPVHYSTESVNVALTFSLKQIHHLVGKYYKHLLLWPQRYLLNLSWWTPIFRSPSNGSEVFVGHFFNLADLWSVSYIVLLLLSIWQDIFHEHSAAVS